MGIGTCHYPVLGEVVVETEEDFEASVRIGWKKEIENFGRARDHFAKKGLLFEGYG